MQVRTHDNTADANLRQGKWVPHHAPHMKHRCWCVIRREGPWMAHAVTPSGAIRRFVTQASAANAADKLNAASGLRQE